MKWFLVCSTLALTACQTGVVTCKEGTDYCGNGCVGMKRDRRNCGACNVLMDGLLVNSCCVLGVECAGAEITTVEGIGSAERLTPLQQCFLEGAALQCGICTPGFLVAAKALLEQNPNPTEHEIRFWLAGNLCRCTGYDKIIRAVQQAAAQMQEGA